MSYTNRPKLKIEPTGRDRLLNNLTLAVLVLLWGYTAWAYASLPQIIPLHYN